MGFWNELVEKASVKKDELVDTASQMSKVSSLNGRLREEKQRLNEVYRSIGEKYVKECAESPNPSLAGIVNEARIIMSRIRNLENEIRVERGVQICVHCGRKISEIKPAAVRPAVSSFCMKCGAELEEGAAYCTTCGSRL